MTDRTAWRFKMLLASMLLAASTSVGAASESSWRFKVLLDDKDIGYHTFSLSRDGERQTLETEASFDVKFLFITAFRYRHRNTETWSGDCLESIEAMTDSNGKLSEVRGRREAEQFSLENASGATALDDCVQTFAYWNPTILESAQLLNSQTGEYEDVAVSLEGADEVLVGGEPVAALRYRLSAKAGDIRLWYSSADRRWLALEAPAKGGRTIRYQPVAVPAPETDEQQFAGSS